MLPIAEANFPPLVVTAVSRLRMSRMMNTNVSLLIKPAPGDERCQSAGPQTAKLRLAQ
jgi:hypothetical protein